MLRAEQAAEAARLADDAVAKVGASSAEVARGMAALREAAMKDEQETKAGCSTLQWGGAEGDATLDADCNTQEALSRSPPRPAPRPMFRFEQTEKEKLPPPQTGLGRVLRRPRHEHDISNVNSQHVKGVEYSPSLKAIIAEHRAEHEAALLKRSGLVCYNYVIGSPKAFYSIRQPYTDEDLFGE